MFPQRYGLHGADMVLCHCGANILKPIVIYIERYVAIFFFRREFAPQGAKGRTRNTYGGFPKNIRLGFYTYGIFIIIIQMYLNIKMHVNIKKFCIFVKKKGNSICCEPNRAGSTKETLK